MPNRVATVHHGIVTASIRVALAEVPTSDFGSQPVPSDERPPSRSARVRLIVLLGSLSAFGPLSIDMYLPALPALRRDFATGASQTQLTLTACLLGLALGQFVTGPISDALGRRRPLLIGLAAYAVASIGCALAPTIGLFTLLRFGQGFAGAAGIVIARAVVRDLHAGVAAARFFSLLMLVNGLAPILAPIFGAQLLRVAPWRGVFVTLAVIGALLLLSAALGLGETVPPAFRQTGGIRATVATLRRMLKDRSFIGYALSCGLAFAAMFAYIAGSPFVLQEIYGVSPQRFSVLFGVNAIGLVVAGQVNGRLVGRVPPARLLTFGLTATAGGGLALLAVVAVGGVGLIGILPALFAVVASLGFVLPNATALALSSHARSAGSASALLGVMQYAIGAAAAPLVGIAGESTALPMAIVMATLGTAALMACLLIGRVGTDRS